MQKIVVLSVALLIGTASVSTPLQSEERFPGIENMMSAEEYKASGMEKLSEAELKALNQWLIRYTANDASVVKREIKEVKEESNKDIRSQIDGTFSGWNGETVFKLKNGQVWKQRLRGTWKTKLQDPEVLIYRNFFGFYELKVVESGKAVGVKRVR